MGRVIGICALLAAIHSLFASRPAKNLTRRLAGARCRNGLYRAAYNVQSLALTTWAAWWFSRLADRDLYLTPPPWPWLMRAGQVVSLLVVFLTVRASGLPSTSLPQVRCVLSGGNLDAEPEAQGPPPAQTVRWP